MAPSSPRTTPVIWVVVHTAEGILKATDLAAFFERSDVVSAHAVADDDRLIEPLVPYERAAWTMRNGNSRSDNLELCGFARWTREEWLANHRGMLRHAGAWIRSRCQARGIPLRKIDAAAVKRGERGVIGHADYTAATGDGTHWDPGPGFPWDHVMATASGEDDMSWDEAFPRPSDGKLIKASDYLRWSSHNIDQALVKLDALAGALSDDETKILAAIRGLGQNPPQQVTADQLAALAEGLAAKLPAELVGRFDALLRQAFARAAQG